MKYKVLLALAIISAATMLLDFSKEAHGNVNGAPTAATGSPTDGVNNTCGRSNCHTGSAVMASSGWITSSIPGTGYVPGTAYTITATCTLASSSKFGFEISPQNAAGSLVGTITAGTNTQVIGGGKYITHTGAGTVGTTGSHTWTFTWHAPVAGTGPFTFYGAFNCANGDTHSSGDIIHTSTLAVIEAPAGIDEWSNKPVISIFPNPIKDMLTVEYTLTQTAAVSVKMYDIQGRVITELISEKEKAAGKYSSSFDMNVYKTGMYFIAVSAGNNVTTEKLMIAH